MFGKLVIIGVFLVVIGGCTISKPDQNTASPPIADTAGNTQIKAIYLVPEKGGQLSAEELRQHSEVKVVHTFDQLKSGVKDKVAIWIDKGSVNLVDATWFKAAPQKSYPLVLVGYNNAFYSFRDVLGVGYLKGPNVDWSIQKLEPGFSVWMNKDETASSRLAYVKGFDKVPTVVDVLNETNPLLDGKLSANVTRELSTENNTDANPQSLVYKNINYGFTLKFPPSWKDNYYVIETDEGVQIYHRKTWEKMGRGRLFTILIYNPKDKWETEGKQITDVVGLQAKYENNKAVFAVIYPTDVQYVAEDKELFEEYQQMNKDVPKIVNSFKLD